MIGKNEPRVANCSPMPTNKYVAVPGDKLIVSIQHSRHLIPIVYTYTNDLKDETLVQPCYGLYESLYSSDDHKGLRYNIRGFSTAVPNCLVASGIHLKKPEDVYVIGHAVCVCY